MLLIKNKNVMKIQEFKTQLNNLQSLQFKLPNGSYVPLHFHIKEVGLNTKHFIDCGGTVREEQSVIMQLWDSTDFDHRLSPDKLLSIIDKSEKIIGNNNLEIEVEYQDTTISKYGLETDGNDFVLTIKKTDCLAKDKCGIPQEKEKLQLAELSETKTACCTPGGGCC
jgi:hypothetical protein